MSECHSLYASHNYSIRVSTLELLQKTHITQINVRLSGLTKEAPNESTKERLEYVKLY